MSESEVEERPKRRLKWPLTRERMVELAVVVFGVMIALGLDSLVQELRLRGDARELEQALNQDIHQAVLKSWERQLVAPCLAQRLAGLAARVAAPGPMTAAPALAFSSGSFEFALPTPYRAPTRVWMTTTFDRALGTEAFKRIPRQRADAYAAFFAQIAERREANAAEFFAISELAPLAYPHADMSDEVRADLLQQIAVLDRHQSLARAVGGQIIEAAFDLPETDVLRADLIAHRADLRTAVARARANYGQCVDAASLDRLIAMAKADPSA